MRLSKVRDYIKQQVTLVDSKLQEWEDAFSVDNIPKTKFSKIFSTSYAISSATKGQQTETLNITVTVNFLFKGERNTITTFDESMDKVNLIALNIMSQDAVYAFRSTDDFPIQSVSRSSQVPQPLNTNDNSILIPLELEMIIIQSIC